MVWRDELKPDDESCGYLEAMRDNRGWGTLMINFYDSADHVFPEGAEYVCLYADGKYAVPDTEGGKFPHVRWITVLGGANAAKYAGIIDYEEGNEAFDGNNLLEFVQARVDAGLRARVYTDLNNFPSVRSKLASLDNRYLVWIATLDGNKLSPEFAGDLWGVQYAGGPTADYDTSVLYGTW
jgi:hypothetical protein